MKKKIVFVVSSELIPYELIKYLEAFHIKVWPKQVNWNEDRSRTCSLLVNEKQYKWAAGLIAGYSNQLRVIEPKNVIPTKPKHRWNNSTVKTEGIKNFLYRVIGDVLLPVSSKIPNKRIK